MRFKPYSVLSVVAAFSLTATITINSYYYRNANDPSRKRVLIPPPQTQRHFTFGYREVFADTLWIRLIQDFDSCGHDGFAEDRDYGKGVALAELPVCNYSWPFRMLDVITDFAPKFKVPYRVGALNLSFLVRDGLGAKRIYEKGIQRFPSEWPLYHGAAYNALEELKDDRLAAEMFKKAVENGAPQWMLAQSARLYAKSGRLEYAAKILRDKLKDLPEDDKYREQYEKRLKEIERQIRQAQ